MAMSSFRRIHPILRRVSSSSSSSSSSSHLLRGPQSYPAIPRNLQHSPSAASPSEDFPSQMNRCSPLMTRIHGCFAENRRTYAKAKKSKGDEESTAVYEDVYPSVKDNTVKQMESSLDSLARELSKLRTGRVSSGTLDHVTVVDNNGIRSPLTHVAAVTVIDNEKLRVTPFDSAIVKCVERGIRTSPLKLNPSTEGEIITVPIPKPTKEYIETMIKVVGKAGETAKTSIRRARQTAMDAIKKSTGHISKDDIKRREKEIDELTKKFVKLVDDSCKAKEKEMLPG